MDLYDWILVVMFAIISIIAGISIFMWYEWKRRHSEAVEMWNKESEIKTNKIVELKKKLDDALHCPNTVSFNSYDCSPITLSTTITVADWSFNYAVNNKDFVEKRDFIIKQAIYQMSEEFTKIPEYIYIDYTQDDIITDNMKVTIKLKILPYKEG